MGIFCPPVACGVRRANDGHRRLVACDAGETALSPSNGKARRPRRPRALRSGRSRQPLVARSSGTVLCCGYPCECVAVTYACAQVQSSVDADFAVLLDRETVMPSALDGGRPSCAVSLGIPPHGSCDAIAAVDKLYIRLYACNAFGASAPALANGGDGVLRLMAPPHPREVVLRSIGLLRLEVQWTSAAGSAVMPIDAFVVQCADEPHFHTVTEFRVKPVRSGATALPPATRPPHACTHTRASKCSRALAEWWV